LFIETIQASKTVYQKQQILHDHDKRKTKEKKNPSPLSSYFKKKKKKKKKKKWKQPRRWFSNVSNICLFSLQKIFKEFGVKSLLKVVVKIIKVNFF
jgi:hypothetical protein